MTMDFKRIQNYTFFGLLIGISILFLWMLRPYFYPVFWAAVLAALFNPLYRRLLRAVRDKQSLAAALTEIIIVLLLVVPLLGVGVLVVQQSISIYSNFDQQKSVETVAHYINLIKNAPLIDTVMSKVNVDDTTKQLSSVGASASKWIYQVVASGGQYTAQWVIQLFIMLYTLFFFLRDGKKFLKQLMHLAPLGDRYELLLYERFVSTARATLKGTFLIGLMQGTIGGIAFAITGIPASLFWGMIMVVLAIIPGVGGSLVMIPALVIMLLLGNYWQAVVLLIGLVIGGTIDNVLRGPLVGKDAQMHPLLIFFATLGGLLAFGVSGIVIGPVITAFLLSIWKIYEEKYHSALEQAG